MKNCVLFTENAELNAEMKKLLENIEDIKTDIDIYSIIVEENILN